MTLPTGSISLAQVNVELNRPANTPINLNDTLVRFLISESGIATGSNVANTASSIHELQGKSYVIANNTGIITANGPIKLPVTSGPSVKVLCVGGGGGGGGGSSRTSHSPCGPGGGGGSGEVTLTTISVTPGQYLYVTVGAAGAGGGARDGGYTPGSNPAGGSNGTGSSVSVVNGGFPVALAGGGSAGIGSQTIGAPAAGGAAGLGGTGSDVLGGVNGQTAQYNITPGGGFGGNGCIIATTIGTSTPYSYGNIGVGGIGNDTGGAYTPLPTYTAATTGTGYGAGGAGGGTNNEFSGEGPGINGAPGSQGAVFIWWGY